MPPPPPPLDELDEGADEMEDAVEEDEDEESGAVEVCATATSASTETARGSRARRETLHQHLGEDMIAARRKGRVVTIRLLGATGVILQFSGLMQ